MDTMVIAEIRGKQYALKMGEQVMVDHIDQPLGTSFVDFKVLYYNDGDGEVLVGKPYLSNIKVETSISGSQRGPKLRSVRYRPRGGLRKVHGHRQDYTLLKVAKIVKT